MKRVAPLLAALAVVALRYAAVAATQQTTPASAFVSERLSVATEGSGPDIILIPGLTGNREVWAPVTDTLNDRYRLHLVQVNGFAGAAPGANVEGPVSAPVAEEIARYIREAGLKRPAVIGHSMGGSIGMMLAARHPHLVGRLMVVDMIPFLGLVFGPPGATAETLRQAADGMRAKILSETPGSPTGTFEQMIPNMTQIEAMRAVILKHARASDRRTVANAFHELVVTDLRLEIARIRVPMTVLYVVPPDPPLPPEQFEAATRQMFASAPAAVLTRIDDSRHFIQFDQPAKFVAEVDALMRR